MGKLATLLILSLFAIGGVCHAANDDASQPIHQLRIYQIFDHNKTAFHERFRDHAARIMKKYDFNIVAMWESTVDGRTEYVYLLEWLADTPLQSQWAKFKAYDERE